jgi:hypothetical protein
MEQVGLLAAAAAAAEAAAAAATLSSETVTEDYAEKPQERLSTTSHASQSVDDDGSLDGQPTKKTTTGDYSESSYISAPAPVFESVGGKQEKEKEEELQQQVPQQVLTKEQEWEEARLRHETELKAVLSFTAKKKTQKALDHAYDGQQGTEDRGADEDGGDSSSSSSSGGSGVGGSGGVVVLVQRSFQERVLQRRRKQQQRQSKQQQQSRTPKEHRARQLQQQQYQMDPSSLSLSPSFVNWASLRPLRSSLTDGGATPAEAAAAAAAAASSAHGGGGQATAASSSSSSSASPASAAVVSSEASGTPPPAKVTGMSTEAPKKRPNALVLFAMPGDSSLALATSAAASVRGVGR